MDSITPNIPAGIIDIIVAFIIGFLGFFRLRNIKAVMKNKKNFIPI